MAENSKIQWTDHTSKMLFAAPQISLSGNRFEMDFFVTGLAKRQPILHNKSKVGVIRKFLDVVCVKVAAFVITAMLTDVPVSPIHSISPFLVFHRTPIVQASLKFAITVGIMSRPAWRSFACNSTDAGLCFGSVGLANPVAWAILSRVAHFSTGFFGHLFTLHRRDECKATFFPCFTNFRLSFFGMSHTGIIPSNLI